MNEKSITSSQDYNYNLNYYNLMTNCYEDAHKICYIILQQLIYYLKRLNSCNRITINENTFNNDIHNSYFSNILKWKNDDIFTTFHN